MRILKRLFIPKQRNKKNSADNINELYRLSSMILLTNNAKKQNAVKKYELGLTTDLAIMFRVLAMRVHKLKFLFEYYVRIFKY